MADLAPVAASVQCMDNTKAYMGWVKVGETVAQGDVVYKPTADSERLKADHTDAEKANAEGVVLTPGGDGEYVFIAKSGATVDLGITPANGAYVVSANAGKIAPYADLASGDFVTILGTVKDGILTVDIKASGGALP